MTIYIHIKDVRMACQEESSAARRPSVRLAKSETSQLDNKRKMSCSLVKPQETRKEVGAVRGDDSAHMAFAGIDAQFMICHSDRSRGPVMRSAGLEKPDSGLRQNDPARRGTTRIGLEIRQSVGDPHFC